MKYISAEIFDLFVADGDNFLFPINQSLYMLCAVNIQQKQFYSLLWKTLVKLYFLTLSGQEIYFSENSWFQRFGCSRSIIE